MNLDVGLAASLGAGILSIALVSLLLAISKGQAWGWADAKTIGLMALGAIGLVVFVVVELRVAEPLVDMRLMRLRGVESRSPSGFAEAFHARKLVF